jgi:ATP-binding cassette subfamily C protein CydC
VSGLRRIVREALALRSGVAGTILAGAAMIVSAIGLMATAAALLARAALQPPLGDLRLVIVGVRAFGIARPVFRYLERVVAHHTTFGLLKRVRVWFFRALIPLAPARLVEQRRGDLLTRAVADIETLDQIVIRVISPPAVALLTAAAASTLLWWFHPSLGLLLFAFMVGGGTLAPLVTWRAGLPLGRDLSTARSRLGTVVVDAVEGAAELVAARRERAAGRDVRRLGAEVERHRARLATLEASSAALAQVASQLAVWSLLVVAIPLVRSGVIDGIEMTVVVLASFAAFEAIAPLGAAAAHASSQAEAAERVFEIVDARPRVVFDGRETSVADPTLCVEGVHFAYPGTQHRVLGCVDLEVRAGARIAVVGPSGSGKSTLAHLLVRFWDPDTGRITIGGRDVRDLTEEALRANVGFIAQRTEILTGTIRDNLALARPDASESEMLEALAAARLDGIAARLPRGLDAPVGQAGARLSGGEQQRLALARAHLRATPILVLDEPTAHLDAITARDVLDALFDVAATRTCIMITHELALASRFDEIALLDEGRVVARGSHETVLTESTEYRELWRLEREMLS